MDRSLYIFTSEKKEIWWYSVRKKIIKKIIERYLIKKRHLNILDIGSGMGGLLEVLNDYGKVSIVETNKDCRNYLKDNFAYIKRIIPSISKIKGKFDLITIFDALEHIKDDKKTIKELRLFLNDGGAIMITVPAFQFLWSSHDELSMHFRRYNKKSIKEVFRDYKEIKISFFNYFLFFPILITRKFFNMLNLKVKQNEIGNNFLFNSILKQIFNIETLLINKIDIPFGTSLYAIYEKK